MRTYWMIEHRYNGRLLRMDGKLIDPQRYDEAVKFENKTMATLWLRATKVIPERYKWSYFSLTEFKSESHKDDERD